MARRLLSAAPFSALLSCCLWSCHLLADDAEHPPVKGRVIGRIWNTHVGFSDMMQYTEQLAEEFGLQRSPLQFPGGRTTAQFSAVARRVLGGQPGQADIKGSLVFLETSPTPGTPHFIEFRSVQSQEEFQKLVKEQSGQGGEMIGADDRFEVRRRFVFNSKTVRFLALDDAGTDDANGNKIPAPPATIVLRGKVDSTTAARIPARTTISTSTSTYYRFHDGVMYSGPFKAVHSMELPSLEQLTLDDELAGLDVHARFELRDIPKHIKEQLWTQIQARTSTQLQRFDNEAMKDYSLRRLLGQCKLELLKAAVFDVDTVEFSIQLPISRTEPVTAELKLVARRESLLAAAISQLNRTPSRMGSLRDEESPLVVSSTLNVPQWSEPLVKGVVDSLRLKLRGTTTDESVGELIDKLFTSLQDTIDAGSLDSAVRIERDPDSGMVLAGGLRLVDAERFTQALQQLLLIKSVAEGFSVSETRIGQHRVVTLSSPGLTVPFTETEVPVNIHMSATGSCLWFAIGGENAIKSLERHLESSQVVLNSRTEAIPIQVTLRLHEWLGVRTEGVSQVPRMLLNSFEKYLVSFTRPQLRLASKGGWSSVVSTPQAASFADQTLTSGTSDMELTLRTSGRTVSVSAIFGTGVGKFLLTSYVAAQNRVLSIQLESIKFDRTRLMDSQGKTLRFIQPLN